MPEPKGTHRHLSVRFGSESPPQFRCASVEKQLSVIDVSPWRARKISTRTVHARNRCNECATRGFPVQWHLPTRLLRPLFEADGFDAIDAEGIPRGAYVPLGH
jgi:hypothetical protein